MIILCMKRREQLKETPIFIGVSGLGLMDETTAPSPPSIPAKAGISSVIGQALQGALRDA